MTVPNRVEPVCPAGMLPALKIAIDRRVDCFYAGLRNETDARNFGWSNFDAKTAAAIEFPRRFTGT